MRAQPFLQYLSSINNPDNRYNPDKARYIASKPEIRGGWEVWMQIEIAHYFLAQNIVRICEREVPYPGKQNNTWISYPPAAITNQRNQAARCDFYMHRPNGSQQDETYIELKCINPALQNAHNDAWNRCADDIEKIQAIVGQNPLINGIALLATQGQLLPTQRFKNLFANNTIKAYAWYPYNNNLVEEFNPEKPRAIPVQFCIVAAALI